MTAAVRIGQLRAEDGAIAFDRTREDDFDHEPSTLGTRQTLGPRGQNVHRDLVSTLGDTSSDVDDIRRTLGGVMPPAQLDAAVASFLGLSEAQAHAITASASTIAKGGVPSLTTLAPIIAGALALTGVGAPVVAVVGAALPIAEEAFKALGLATGPQNCVWTVNGLCFTGLPPSSPVDPLNGQPNPAWTTWDTYLAEKKQMLGGRGWGLIELTFHGWGIIECEIPLLDPQDRFSQFLLTYYAALIHNIEQAINGHPFVAWPGTDKPNAQAIFDNLVNAWNQKYAAPPFVELRGAPRQPSTVYTPSHTCDGVKPGDFVRALLFGDIDGRPHDPLRINTGPELVHIPHLPPKGGGKSAGGGSSSGSGLAAAGTAAAGLGALWLLLGRPSLGDIVRHTRSLFGKG